MHAYNITLNAYDRPARGNPFLPVLPHSHDGMAVPVGRVSSSTPQNRLGDMVPPIQNRTYSPFTLQLRGFGCRVVSCSQCYKAPLACGPCGLHSVRVRYHVFECRFSPDTGRGFAGLVFARGPGCGPQAVKFGDFLESQGWFFLEKANNESAFSKILLLFPAQEWVLLHQA